MVILFIPSCVMTAKLCAGSQNHIVPSTRVVNSFTCKRKHSFFYGNPRLFKLPYTFAFLFDFACTFLNVVNFFFSSPAFIFCFLACMLSLTHTLYMTDLGMWWTPAPSTQVQKGKVSAMYLFIPLISIANASDLSHSARALSALNPWYPTWTWLHSQYWCAFQMQFLYNDLWLIIKFLFDWISNE